MLYAITDQRLAEDDLCERVAAAVAAGCDWIQYRDKSTDTAQRHRQASRLRDTCSAHGARLIINDDIELALAVGADGVHLGQQDQPLARARDRLGPNALIGITCHASLQLARRAQRDGADYVAFGRFFPSATKPGAPAAPIDLLRQARQEISLPLIAIGGIHPANAAQLVAAGADRLAVCEALFGRAEVEAQIVEFTRAIRSARQTDGIS